MQDPGFRPTPPAYRVYVSNHEGEINYKEEACGLWPRQSQDGRTYFAGKLKDGRKVQLWPVQTQQPRDEGPPPYQDSPPSYPPDQHPPERPSNDDAPF
ncbi:MAG: hypothetical protein AMJ65_09685 [Phycisphaerae bacterium SG8_4]|nr:MAG: hypothetical protein AMJ65_09685 [Phycisphaerae bacterium SG8_4]